MRNPYHITEPGCVSFSGGRSSGYMLYQILQAHGGTLPEHIKVVFANTGKEMPETLDFVRDCGEQWGVDITWVELGKIKIVGTYEKGRHKGKPIRKYVTKVVSYETASRNGEPFRDLVLSRRMLPNVMARFCTAELKVLRIHDISAGALQIIGIRRDEPRRAAKIHGKIDGGLEQYCPMHVAGATKAGVGDFWKAQPFDLMLPNDNGVTPLGNCDLCFLKGRKKRLSIMRERPELSEWWVETERQVSELIGKPAWFCKGETYSDMQLIATGGGQGDMLSDEDMSCFCGD